MLTIYIIFLCFALIIALLNILNIFHIHFEDVNVDMDTSVDTSVDMDSSVDMDTSGDMGSSVDMGSSADLGSSVDMDNSIYADVSLETAGSIDTLEIHRENNVFISVIMFILRFSFYFSMGFGSVGVIATLFHQPVLSVFIVAVITGLIAFFMTKYITKLFIRTIDTAINEKDFIGLEAVVVIPIYSGQIGTINIKYNDRIYTRYARLTDKKQNIDIEQRTIVKIFSTNSSNEFIVDTI